MTPHHVGKAYYSASNVGNDKIIRKESCLHYDNNGDKRVL